MFSCFFFFRKIIPFSDRNVYLLVEFYPIFFLVFAMESIELVSSYSRCNFTIIIFNFSVIFRSSYVKSPLLRYYIKTGAAAFCTAAPVFGFLLFLVCFVFFAFVIVEQFQFFYIVCKDGHIFLINDPDCLIFSKWDGVSILEFLASLVSEVV